MLKGLIAEAANQKAAQIQKKFELKERHVRAMERIAAALETLAAAIVQAQGSVTMPAPGKEKLQKVSEKPAS